MVSPVDAPDSRLDEFLTASQFRYRAPKGVPRVVMAGARKWSRVASRIGDLLYERGLDTSRHAQEISHLHPERVWYEASGWSYLRRMLRRREVGPHDVFVDFGSGKGRVLLQAAARYPFARVIGVEISEALNDIARANVAKRRDGLAGRDIELVTADAVAYEVPDSMTVGYFYYPFVGETFRRVMENIVASHTRRPRRIRLIYVLPTMEEQILSTGLFRRVRSRRVIDMGIPGRVSMYEASGETASSGKN